MRAAQQKAEKTNPVMVKDLRVRASVQTACCCLESSCDGVCLEMHRIGSEVLASSCDWSAE